ncbi:uncharacterized protein BX664DRAFT_338292 [Halteromyces radiatus]|uniref:uncharacterized protein n=1 Tax=Halteromyces radiatus TaxID=101107 RepID=UPI00221EE3A1|nr:uncharacterized protein BX664DRAFT_338292 [Halteromyces radiatus]KAI8084996.1 hypothetical protein BX664DRAFT_338292 [Halteromyces radiatus]
MIPPSSTITKQQADEIKQLALDGNKAVFQRLKDMEKEIQARHKKTRIYSWTIAALQRQYQVRLCEDRLLMERRETQWNKLIERRHQLQQEIVTYTNRIQEQESQLQDTRTHAHQRYEKYKRRQHQYHRYAKVPLFGHTYKRKYLRAQKKNQLAESQVAACRHVIDAIKDKRIAAAREIHQDQQAHEQLKIDIQCIRDRISKNENLCNKQWKDGLTFWTERMALACLAVDQKIVSIQHLLRQQSSTQELDSVLTSFQLACLDYEQTETYGEQQSPWSLENVDFTCAKCMQLIHQEKPMPDKNRTSDILCATCYQTSRTTMIIKKKLGFLQSPSSSSSSSLVTSPYSSLLLPSSPSPPLTPNPSRQSSFTHDSPSYALPIPPPKDPFIQKPLKA